MLGAPGARSRMARHTGDRGSHGTSLWQAAGGRRGNRGTEWGVTVPIDPGVGGSGFGDRWSGVVQVAPEARCAVLARVRWDAARVFNAAGRQPVSLSRRTIE